MNDEHRCFSWHVVIDGSEDRPGLDYLLTGSFRQESPIGMKYGIWSAASASLKALDGYVPFLFCGHPGECVLHVLLINFAVFDVDVSYEFA